MLSRSHALVASLLAIVLGSSPSLAGVREQFRIVADADGREYVADHVLVKFHDMRGADAQAAIAQLGAVVSQEWPELGIHVLKLPAGTTVEAAIESLTNTGLVEFAEPDYLLHIDLVPNDPLRGNQYGLTQVRCYQAWDVSTGDINIKVGVVDTGIQYTHPDLNDRIIRGPDYVNGDNDPWDDNGHGTHVSGIAAAETNNGVGVAGVAWNATIMAVKSFDAGGNATTTNAVNGVNWCVANGAHVVNMSWSGGASGSLSNAINNCINNNVLPVAAAGNQGTTTPRYPAGYANCVGVAASTAGDVRWTSSNWGPSWVKVAAPGESVYSTITGSTYTYLSGTSMATPHVAGEAALLFAILGEDAPVTLIRDLIYNNVFTGNNWPTYVQFGRIDVGLAAQAAMAARPCLTMAVNPPAGGTTVPAAGSQTCVRYNEVVNISATPNPGYQFVNWTGPAANPNSPNTTVTVTGNVTVTANFEVSSVCGDFDGDGDVDLSDFTQFQLCFGGSNNPPAPTCPPGVDADCDDDGDVDLADFLIFQNNFTGSLAE